MLACLRGLDGDLFMQMMRRGDQNSIDLWIVEQSTPVTVTLATMFGRKGGRGICILPAARNEPNTLNFCHRAGVNRSEVASSDNSYSDHAFAFSYAASMTCIAAR
jgi:hypothetical protein